MMPAHFWVGLLILTFSEAAMLWQVEPFWSWHTPIAWTAYILLVDGFIYKIRGSSWLLSSPREFFFLAAMSIPLWLVFEAYNMLIKNWYYVNLPPNFVVRYLGYAWAFATISPGIFQTAELVSCLRALRPGLARSLPSKDEFRLRTSARRLLTVDYVFILIGAAMLLVPVFRPSPYLAAPVFLGFVLLLDPINAHAGDQSLLRDCREGRYDRLVNLLGAGFICGVLWEFWNYWARAKWIYTVPILSDLRIFEMPVLGYFGFPPFALECFTMYVFVRRLVWRRAGRPIGR